MELCLCNCQSLSSEERRQTDEIRPVQQSEPFEDCLLKQPSNSLENGTKKSLAQDPNNFLF